MVDVDTSGNSETILESLNALLGPLFVDWVLALSDGPMTPQQDEVAALLIRTCSTAVPGNPSLPRRLLVSSLLGYDSNFGTTFLNALRVYAGGAIPALPESTGDAVLDALNVLAAECYGELLLADEFPGNSVISAFSSPQGKAAVIAVSDDPDLPFAHGADEGDSVSLCRSTGSGGGLQLCSVGPSLIGAAFERLQFRAVPSSLELVLEQLPHTLATARQAFRGERATTLATASLTGVVMPPGSALTFGWGRLRPAELDDHPHWVRRTLGERRTSMRLEDGREVSISDAGDVILETEVPFAIEIREDFDLAEGWPDLSSSEDLEARITQVRLAHLLAGTDHRAPVMLPVWRRFVEPLAQGGGVGWSDPQQFAGRTPTLLSADQLTRWQEWIDRLSTVPVRRLGPAPTRLLRASAERRDGADSLIDAVIAWEALFGAETEATLRVSGALAKLLHAAGDERRSLRRRAAEIYRLRSKVVHGVDVDPREIAEAGLEATDLGIRALRVIVSDRPHLIELASGERSTQILME